MKNKISKFLNNYWNEIHEKLTSFFGVKKIHSEYGMTELLSQAYSFGDGLFRPPPQMNIL